MDTGPDRGTNFWPDSNLLLASFVPLTLPTDGTKDEDWIHLIRCQTFLLTNSRYWMIQIMKKKKLYLRNVYHKSFQICKIGKYKLASSKWMWRREKQLLLSSIGFENVFSFHEEFPNALLASMRDSAKASKRGDWLILISEQSVASRLIFRKRLETLACLVLIQVGIRCLILGCKRKRCISILILFFFFGQKWCGSFSVVVVGGSTGWLAPKANAMSVVVFHSCGI